MLSFMSNPNQYPFPLAIGTEEETGLLVGVNGEYDEPYELTKYLSYFIPPDLLGRGQNQYLTNGFKIYDGGSPEQEAPTNIERATPETATPKELTIYSRASEMLMLDIVKRYASAKALGEEASVDIRLQRRVVDAEGSRKACHDNFAVLDKRLLYKTLPPSLTNFISARSLVVGAGLVTENDFQFSQKIGGVTYVEGYGYLGSMHRSSNDQDGSRLEIRCGDQNISDWATMMRVGSMALVIAINQTPLATEINENSKMMKDAILIQRAKIINRCHSVLNGRFELNSLQQEAVSYLRYIAETSMDRLPEYTDLPDEYFRVAKELYDFTDDLQLVAEGQKPLEALADRADWAAKLIMVNRDIARDKNFGIKRKFGDFQSRAKDLQYDLVRVTQNPDEKEPTVKFGSGYKLRARGVFRSTIPEKDVLKAFRNPPQTTRAKVRGEIIGKYYVHHLSTWGHLYIDEGEESEKVALDPVDSSEISPRLLGILDYHKKYC